MRLLFISPDQLDAPRGGRAMLARLHRDVLRGLLGPSLAEHPLIRGTGTTFGRLAGHIDGATPAGIAAVLDALDAHGADTVWLDGSNLGRIAHVVKQARPAVRVVTFCHNVEARFFLGALRRAPRARAAGVLAANYAAERLALRHSHTVIALSERDSGLLGRLYGRRAGHILPMALADQLSAAPHEDQLVVVDAPLLFVGGAFYANRAGIAWFAKEVVPHTATPTEIIGHGMEDMRTQLEAAPGVRVIGPVDRLEPHYRSARAAIAPIFDGSGMKTKVAEALMFGKRVIGSPEAFSGYEAIAAQAGWICRSADDFARAIRTAAGMNIKALDPALRALYERDHSAHATETRLAALFELAGPSNGDHRHRVPKAKGVRA